MKKNIAKIISILVCVCVVANFGLNSVFAESKNQGDDYKVIKNTEDVYTIMDENDGDQIYASLDKNTKEITVQTIEKSKKRLLGFSLGEDKKTDYLVIIDDINDNDLSATLINKDTKKEHKIYTKRNSNKVSAQVPLVLVPLAPALIDAVIVGSGIIIAGILAYGASEVAKDIIAKHKKGSINREFPSEYLGKTMGEIEKDAKAGNKKAKKAKKLLEDKRFDKGDNRK